MKTNFLFIIPICALMLASCGGNNAQKEQEVQAPTFAPKQQETVVTKRPASRKVDSVLAFVGQVKLNIMLPEVLPDNSKNVLHNKMVAMTSVNGVGSVDASPILCIIPTLAETNHDITATVPAKHKIKYDFNVWVANLETGEVFASAQQDLLGIGDSEELALGNAMSAISPNDNKWQEMLKTAQDRIIDFYNTNGDRLIKEAQSYIGVNDYSKAMLILNNIPMACGEVYDRALEVKNNALDQYFQNDAEYLISKMKAYLALPRDDENGFSYDFLAVYAMVPPNSKAKAEADALYAEYVKSLDETAKKNMEKQQREWEAEQKRLDREAEIRLVEAQSAAQMQAEQNAHELAMYKEQMAAEVAIQGQQQLLEKYKKDASYNKLGRIWKLFYIGRE